MSRYLDRLKALTGGAEKSLREPPTKPPKVAEGPPKVPFVSFGGCVGGHISKATALYDPEEVEIGERKGIASGGVPEPYLDAWAVTDSKARGCIERRMATRGDRRWPVPRTLGKPFHRVPMVARRFIRRSA